MKTDKPTLTEIEEFIKKHPEKFCLKCQNLIEDCMCKNHKNKKKDVLEVHKQICETCGSSENIWTVVKNLSQDSSKIGNVITVKKCENCIRNLGV